MSVLAEIIAATRDDLAQQKQAMSPVAMTALAAGAREKLPVRDVFAALSRPGLAVIAEVKRRSPSVGDLSAIADPAALAAGYAAAGAAMISVLTEPHYFRGSPDDLAAVRAAVDIPVLRKDFIVDEYQIAHARALGADAVLLIVAALADDELAHLLHVTKTWGMAALVEVHDEEEALRALASGAEIIGVNSRDLTTLAVDPNTFQRVRPLLTHARITVAESGVSSPEDAQRYADLGADAVLVGQALVQALDMPGMMRSLIAAGG